MQQSWIPLEKLLYALADESYIVVWIIFIFALLFYKFFLKKISENRHNNLKSRFKSIPTYLIISTIMTFLINESISYYPNNFLVLKIASYLLVLSLFIGTVGVIKLAQTYAYLYLFFSNMTHGVPKLLANLFTFIFSLFLLNLIASSIFSIHLGTLLATSAVFSIVLGLALQDTLGNFFSGISLQIENPFKIGDWIEVNYNEEKWLGQVTEISWRATFLISFSDELIMIPNKTIAQGQIIIISQGNKNIRLNQTFRFSYDVDIENAKKVILDTMKTIDGIMSDPPIRVLIIETTPQFLEIKVIYSLVDFSTRYTKGDEIITKVLNNINQKGLRIQAPKIEIEKCLS